MENLENAEHKEKNFKIYDNIRNFYNKKATNFVAFFVLVKMV